LRPQESNHRSGCGVRWRGPSLVLIAVAALGALVYFKARASRISGELLRAQADTILDNPALVRYAEKRAPQIYQKHCVSCHGATLQGDRSKGAPNLADNVWLYGTGSISDIETTILYGIRSGHPKSRNLIDMPALGRTGHLSPRDVEDVVDYVLSISGQAYDADAAGRGLRIYRGEGACYDCHGADAKGISDYGTPGLTGRGGAWLYGGDKESLRKSIVDGRHGRCPAWIGTLDFVQIRSLSVYLNRISHSAATHRAGANETP
jgi:cytochrome c oxidase cbb3-type subunit 3